MTNRIQFTLVSALALALLLLAACQPATQTTPLPEAEPTEMTLPTEPPVAATEPPAASGDPAITLDLAGIADGQLVEAVDAQPDTAGAVWEAAAHYSVVSLLGYPVTDHRYQAQVFVYPLEGMAEFNPAAAQAAADLRALLESRQPGETLPFLPLYNELQALHAQVKFIDFPGGSGVRYLAWYSQAPVRVSSQKLLYTFQGLTSDGKYYVSAVLPVTHPDLPAVEELFSENADELVNYQPYLAETAAALEGQPANSFTPSLDALDALVGSIEVK